MLSGRFPSQDRPSAYAIISNAAAHLAVVRTAAGCYLPDGGIGARETAVTARCARSSRNAVCGLFFVYFLMPQSPGGSFRAAMFRYPGKGGWTFVEVPERLAPPVTHGWGRTPVHATLDEYAWEMSVWRGKDGRTLLAVPKVARGDKEPGDIVRVRLTFRSL